MNVAERPVPTPVAVFAHNEAEYIVACLDSLQAASQATPLEIFVLANGCTDLTQELVRDYAARHGGVHVVSIPLGDKANAWNVYIHEVAPDRPIHVFVDGDVEADSGAIVRLAAALEAHPEAHAASGFPSTGRSRKMAHRKMLEEHSLAGNLYALRGSFVARLKESRVRLPVGLVREDGLVGALAKWDLDPRYPWDARRIIPCPDATFRFQTLSPFRLDDWRFQWKRRIRYAVGYFENRMLGPILKREGISGMPASVDELYARSGIPRRSDGRGLEALFRLIALSRLRRHRSFREPLATSRQD